MVVGIVPYVPTPELAFLQRDTLSFVSALSFNGGPDGVEGCSGALLPAALSFLHPGGALLLEFGGAEADVCADDLARLGYADVSVLADEEAIVAASRPRSVLDPHHELNHPTANNAADEDRRTDAQDGERAHVQQRNQQVRTRPIQADREDHVDHKLPCSLRAPGRVIEQARGEWTAVKIAFGGRLPLQPHRYTEAR